MTFTEFKHIFLDLFAAQKDVSGVCIVGSYARGGQQPGSDIDAVVFCSDPDKYISNRSWMNVFGSASDVQYEQWGPVQTLRAFLESGLEIEFNFSTLSWANIPVDPGTYRVVSEGFEIHYDPSGQLLKLKKEVLNENTAWALEKRKK